MKLMLLMIGKTTENSLQSLIQDYVGRLQFYISLEVVVLPELKNTKKLSVSEQKEKEAEMLFKQLEAKDHLILLDEKGKQYSSTEFAQFMGKKLESTIKRTIFVIGGPYGFAERVYERADGMLSLSRMTFSHQMIRLLFTEQLYRAMTILKGENYHHE